MDRHTRFRQTARAVQSVIVAAGVSCGGATTGPSPLSTGLWGGDHVTLAIAESSAHLEFDCAHGDIPARPSVDRLGQFEIAGSYVREHGGPIRTGEVPDTRPATYSGKVVSMTMTLTIRLTDTNESVGQFTLAQGSSGRVLKCL